MLQLRNPTPLTAIVTLFPDPDGVDTLYAVVKGTFTLGTSPRLTDEQVPVLSKPVFVDDPATGSVRLPADVGLTKPSTDVLVVGHAHAPFGRPATVVDVGVQVGPVWQGARVFGDRSWRDSGVSVSMTEPEPFVMMPLVWERAYGGVDVTASGPVPHPQNPSGVGFRVKDGTTSVDGTPVANIEDPRALIGSWREQPAPIGFSPLREHWEPRRSYAGTYDEAWQKHRAPYLPADFDARFLQVAPPPMVAPSYLRGGEAVRLSGLSPGGEINGRLPTAFPEVTFVRDGSRFPASVVLDTVVLYPDNARVSLVWRSEFPCDKSALRVAFVEIGLIGRES